MLAREEMRMANNAKLPNIEAIKAMGLDPKTMLPVKFTEPGDRVIRGDILKQLRIKDEQEYVNRLVVHTPGLNMSSMEFFRLMYYHPNLALMVLEGQPYLMPYSYDGGLDFYNRPRAIHPVPLTQGSNTDDSSKSEADKAREKALREIMAGYKKTVIYDVVPEEDLTDDIFDNACVLVRDYTQQNSNVNIPRAKVNDAVLRLESDVFQYMRTSLLTGSGARGIKVNDPDAASSVVALSNAIDNAALNGSPYVPLLSRMDIQELTNAGVLHVQDYMLAIQGLDNYRKQCLGVDNAAMFDKKAYVNEAQTNTSMTNSLPLIDSLNQIQSAFDIWNSIYGTDWYVEINPALMNVQNSGMIDESEGGSGNGNASGNERKDVQ